MLFPVAILLERMFPDRYCWASLVSWALYGEESKTIAEARAERDSCAAEPKGDLCACWCGKYRDDEKWARRLAELGGEPPW
jgi:hypothetical protein